MEIYRYDIIAIVGRRERLDKNLYLRSKFSKNMTNFSASTIKIAFFSNHGPDAMAVLRVLGPAKKLGIEVVTAYQNGELLLDSIDGCNLFLHQRDFCKDLDAYETMVQLAHARKIPVIFDLDDLLFELPEYHPDRISGYFTSALLPMVLAAMEADFISVSTSYLANYLEPLNPNIHVLPNYLNDDLWKIDGQESIPESTEDTLTIGYMGGHSHKPDIKMILPVLHRVVEKYPGMIKFKFWGIAAPSEIQDISESAWNPPYSYEYSDFASYFQTQTADICISPLRDNLFNRSKSAIKYLEYTAAGMPAVFSNIPPYQDVIQDNKNGCLAGNEEEWFQALSSLIENKEKRIAILQNQRTDVKENWVLSRNLETFKNFYITCLDRRDAKSHKQIPVSQVLNRISSQIEERFVSEGNRITDLMRLTVNLEESNAKLKSSEIDLNHQLAEIKESHEKMALQVNELTKNLFLVKDELFSTEEELINMSLSKSWQMTRPLRKFYRLVKKWIHS